MKKPGAKQKFNFEQLKASATHLDIRVRMKAFTDYFDMFEEFPSYLYDNSSGIDATLLNTIEKLKADPETSKQMQAGIEVLLNRLPSARTL